MSCTAVSGAIATSSWLLVPLDPFDAVTPITWKFVPLTATVAPTGSLPLNSSSATVGPITSTRLCALLVGGGEPRPLGHRVAARLLVARRRADASRTGCTSCRRR